MSFCGQCGFQLAPEDTRCPRCGAAVQPEPIASPTANDRRLPDDATVESPSYMSGGKSQQGAYLTPGSPPSVSQPKLVLGANPYDALTANEATSMMNAPAYQEAPYPSHTSSAGYAEGYFSPQPAYPPNAVPQQPGYAPAYTNTPVPTARRRGSRTTGLVFILLGILLILGALVVFALQHNGLIGGKTSGTSIGTPAPTTPAEQAQAVVQRYYTSVNNQDYTTAYNLWKNNTQKLADFKNGYRYTKHTDVTFGSAQTRSDGKIYLPVTINATEIVAATGATRENTYSGYYLLEKQLDGTWLIFNGDLKATHP